MANVSLVQANHERNAVEEMKTAEASGRFHFQPSGVPAEDLLFLGKQFVFFLKIFRHMITVINSCSKAKESVT